MELHCRLYLLLETKMLNSIDDPTPHVEDGAVCIPVTRGLVALVDIEDYHLVAGFKWHATFNGYSPYARAVVYDRSKHWTEGRTTIAMHKLILPNAIFVDHIDGYGLNNRRFNLRPSDPHSNQYNSKDRVGKSKFRGVVYLRGKWQAQIKNEGVNVYLGVYLTEEEAARAYDEGAKKIAGVFARLNFPGRVN